MQHTEPGQHRQCGIRQDQPDDPCDEQRKSGARPADRGGRNEHRNLRRALDAERPAHHVEAGWPHRTLAEPQRRRSGYRQYGEETIARLRFIRRAKDLGFTLKEIGELLSLRVSEQTTCAEVRRQAEAKIADIEQRLRTLQRMKRALVRLTRQCRGSGPVGECPILEAIEGEADQGDATAGGK